MMRRWMGTEKTVEGQVPGSTRQACDGERDPEISGYLKVQCKALGARISVEGCIRQGVKEPAKCGGCRVNW